MKIRPDKMDKKHPAVARETLDDIKELGSSAGYRAANRDRALGEADRTGRHFDEDTEASEDRDAD